MSSCDASRWNRRYAEEAQSWLETPPRALLLDSQSWLPSRGFALDAAAGVATNGLFLAKRGMHVTALDISEVGLRLGLSQARRCGLAMDAAVCDLNYAWLPKAFFDVILNFRFLIRSLFSVYRQAVKPGGYLFFETYVRIRDNSDHRDYYLDPGELIHQFHDWDLLHWSQSCEEPTSSHPSRTMERLIVRKPASTGL